MNDRTLNTVGLFVHPRYPAENDIWYLTTYYKPKSNLVNVFNRLQQAANILTNSAMSIGKYTNSDIDEILPLSSLNAVDSINTPVTVVPLVPVFTKVENNEVIPSNSPTATTWLNSTDKNSTCSPSIELLVGSGMDENGKRTVGQYSNGRPDNSPKRRLIENSIWKREKDENELIKWFMNQIDELKAQNSELRNENKILFQNNCNLKIENEIAKAKADFN